MLPTRLCKSFPVLLAIPLSLASVSGRSAEEHPPGDTCVLILTLPEGATVTVDGRDYGTKRTLNYQSLAPGRTYQTKVRIQFPGGQVDERSILVEGGRRLNLALADPDVVQATLVPQTKAFWSMDPAVSPDGRYLARGGNDGMVTLWDIQTGRKLRVYPFYDLGLGVNPVAFSPDGQYLIADFSKELLLCDVVTGRRERTFKKTISSFSYKVCSSADGRNLLVLGTDDREDHREELAVEIWDYESGRTVRSIAIPGSPFHYSMDDKLQYLIVWASYLWKDDVDADILVWNLLTGKRLHAVKLTEHVSSATMSPTGEAFAINFSREADSGEDGRRYETAVFDTATGKEMVRLPSAIAATRDDAREISTFSPDGRRVITAGKSEGLILWKVPEGNKVWSQPLQLEHYELTFSPNGARLAVIGYRHDPQDAHKKRSRRREIAETHVFDTSDGSLICVIPKRHEASFVNNGAKLVFQDNVWDAQTGQELHEFGQSMGSTSVAFSPDGSQLVIGDAIWEFGESRPIRTLGGTSSIHVASCQGFSRDGRHVVTIENDLDRAVLHLWDTATGRRLMEFSGHSELIQSAVFTPDGKHIVSCANDGKAVVWDVATGNQARVLKAGKEEHDIADGVYDVAVSPDGRFLVTAVAGSVFVPLPPFGNTTELAMWDLQSGQKIRTFPKPSDQYVVTFSPDGRYVFSGGRNRAMLWDARNGNSIRTFTDKEGYAILSVAFHPEGRYAMTTYRLGKAILWDTATGKQVHTFRDPDGWVLYGAFSPDGRYAATGSNVVRLWDVATGAEVAQLMNVGRDGDWLAATPGGYFDGSDRGRQIVTYRVGNGLNVVPVDRFFQDFYRPGLLTEIWQGARPLRTTGLGTRLAPNVKVLSPKASGPVREPTIALKVQVTDAGGGIRNPWLLHNGARILAPAQPTEKGKTLDQTFQVALVEGDNRLECFSASEDGSWESEPAVITLTYEQALGKPDLYLLAVGINQYAEQAMNLRFAAPDAAAMAELFTQRGRTLYGDGHVKVTKLLDGQATTSGIEQALAGIAKTARAQDTLLVFLAGHGTVLGQRYYFIPHEYQTRSDKLEEDIRQQGLAGDVLGDWLAAVPALKRVVIFDTCQSGGAVGLERTSRNPFAFRGALERLSRAQGIFTIAATAAGDEAQEVSELGHGVLTYALLAGLGAVDSGPLKEQAIEPKEGKLVEVRDWFSFAQDKVPRLTGLYFGREQFVGFSSHGESFPLLPVGKQP